MPAAQRPVSIPVLWVCFILSMLSFSSCVDKIKTDIVAFRALDEGLANSNKVIGEQNEAILADLENKMANPATKEKAAIWYPKAKLIQKLSKEVYSYIDELRSDLKKEAGLKINDGVESFKESDKISVMRLFDKKGKGEELYDRLKNYKKDILTAGLGLAKEIDNMIIVTTPAFDANKEKQDFTQTFFDDISTAAGLAMLSKFQNNVRIAENKTLSYCDNKIVNHFRNHDVYVGFAIANSSCVKTTEEIEIMAGIGALSRSSKPEIIVEGRNIPLDTYGTANDKFRASDKRGKHTVPVEINYIDLDAVKRTIPKTVEYIVAQ